MKSVKPKGLIPGSDKHMWSGESEAQKSRYTYERSYSPGSHVLGFCVTSWLRHIHILSRIIQVQSLMRVSHTRINIKHGCYELFQTSLVTYNDYVPVHCQLLFLYMCYLQRKQLPTCPFPTETFLLVCKGNVIFVDAIHMV